MNGYPRSISALVFCVILFLGAGVFCGAQGDEEYPGKRGASDSMRKGASGKTPAENQPSAVISGPKPIPRGKDTWTQADVQKMRLEWLLRETVDAYLRNEQRDKTKDKAVVQFLQEVCPLAIDLDKPAAGEQLEKEGKALLASGCNDPMVKMWVGWVLSSNDKPKEAGPLIEEGVQGIEKGAYPKALIYFGAERMLRDWLKSRVPYGPEQAAWEERIIQSMIQAADAGEFRPEEVYLAARFLDNVSSMTPRFRHEFWFMVQKQAASAKHLDPWLTRVITGRAERELAWKDRGSGWAFTVTEEGWRGFGEHLEKARENLAAAWKMKPNWPEAAAEMITVVMGAGGKEPGETERTWFDRAVAAQMDNIVAYEKLRHALLPRWGGSHRAMYELGKECLDTKRFDTNAPMLYLSTLCVIARDMPHEEGRYLFRNPAVRENLKTLFDGMLNEPSQKKNRDRLLTQQALVQAWSGDYSGAKTMLEKIQPPVRLTPGFGSDSLSWDGQDWNTVQAELRLFTGPHKAALEKAEQLGMESKPEESAAQFEKVLSECKGDKEARRYLLSRIIRSSLGFSDCLYKTVTPLDSAARTGNARLVSLCVENGADPNEQDTNGVSLLHSAAALGNLETVEALLQKGADINKRDNQGDTPLTMVCYRGQSEMARFLIEKGADIRVVPYYGWTALHRAIESCDDASLTALLLEKGADPTSPIKEYGDPPLNVAAIHGKVAAIDMLLQKGVDINKRNSAGAGPLCLAVDRKHPEAARLLVEKGADVNQPGSGNQTPLAIAIGKDQGDLARYLVEKGANVNAASNGWTPLLLCADHSDDPDLAKFLLEKGADINAALQGLPCPLYQAICWRHFSTARVLIENGADVNLIYANGGWTPLFMAIKENHLDTVRLLLQKGAKIDVKSQAGQTPLDLARELKREEVVKILSEQPPAGKP